MTVSRRLVVTGHNKAGQSCVASSTNLPSRDIPGFPGYGQIDFWGADKTLHYPDSGERPEYELYFPPIGGFRFIEISLPPRSDVRHDTSATGESAAKMKDEMPGLVEMMDSDRPGILIRRKLMELLARHGEAEVHR